MIIQIILVVQVLNYLYCLLYCIIYIIISIWNFTYIDKWIVFHMFTCLHVYVIHFICYLISSQSSFELFMLSIIRILHTEPHVSNSITYYFINKSNSEVLIWNVISISFKLFTCITVLQDLRTWTVTWKVYDKIVLRVE